MPEITFKVHHASFIVADTARALEFYHGILGLPLAERPDMGFPGAWLQLGEQQIHLMELENPDSMTDRPKHGGRDRHVALCVKELAPVRELLDKHNVPYTLSISGRQALFCRDPDGNALEMLEPI